MGPTTASGKVPPPDVSIVGGITQVSTDMLEHLLGSGTAPGIEDLHTAAPPDHTHQGLGGHRAWVDQKLSHEGPRVWPRCPPPKHQAENCILLSA